MKKRLKLIPEWKQGAKLYSNQILLLIGSINFIWALVPAQWTQGIPQIWLTYATVVLVPIGVLARMVKQNLKGRDDNDEVSKVGDQCV